MASTASSDEAGGVAAVGQEESFVARHQQDIEERAAKLKAAKQEKLEAEERAKGPFSPQLVSRQSLEPMDSVFKRLSTPNPVVTIKKKGIEYERDLENTFSPDMPTKR